MRGRDTPSPGLEATARYVADQFRTFGLAPGGDGGTFVQRYPIQRVRLDLAAARLAVDGGPTWRVGTDAIRHFGTTPPEGVSGAVAVVSGSADATEALSRESLAGRIVLIVTPLDQTTNRMAVAALRHDPLAVVLVTPRPQARWQQLLGSQDRERVVTGWSRRDETSRVVETRDSTVAGVLRAHGYELAAAMRRSAESVTVTALPDLRMTLVLTNEVVNEFTAPNVVGILEGSDAALKDEYLVYSAHMDHVGVGRAAGGDSIYNGADDDASGTAGVIELAEAFSKLEVQPKRSVIFLTVSGEEKGLWGSEYFAERPPVPIERVVANLNADMIGRNWRDTIVVIGKQHSDLGATLERVTANHPELDMTAIDDLWPNENFYRRSDHFNFARKGVPILFFFNGVHEDYHGLDDEADRIDGEKAARVARLVFYLAAELANTPNRPEWNPESYARIVDGPSARANP